ncbi:MAG: ABC transporter permease subunit [Proteobacteria bacterium]|nr:ABC transporter permease subunit [Pseudomonadota bacterium]
MSFLFDSLYSAILLTVSFDRELFSVVLVSLQVSGASTVLASLMGVPLGFLVAFEEFKGKQLVITVLNTLLAVPTVVIGLFVYVFISRRGIFGPMDLLYTKQAIVIGQTFLILPLVATLTIAAVIRIDDRYRKTAMTLGANRLQTAWVVVREARFALIAAVIAAFGRVISEVGISMMLGGNAKGFTRTMTTAMALEYDKGEFVLAVALGIILLLLAFGINLLFNFIQGRTGNR